MSRKLKTLALIIRSLPEAAQRAIYEQLPMETVEKINSISTSIEDELTQEDWDYFTNSWPEFSSMIQRVHQEAKQRQQVAMMSHERKKVREYLEYALGRRKDRPKISQSIATVIERFAEV